MDARDDLELMAYVDGELDDVAARAFEHRVAGEPDLAARVERERALRRQLRALYDPVLDDAVPPALAALLATPPATRANERVVVDFASERAARSALRARVPRQGVGRLALAASALVGLGVGLLLQLGGVGPRGANDALVADSDGAWLARGELDAALTDRLGADGGEAGHSAGEIRVGLSFQARDSRYCRAFALQRTRSSAGLACRSGDAWRVEVLTATEADASPTPYRTAASSWPTAVVQAVDARRAGDMLDAEAERAARGRGWKP